MDRGSVFINIGRGDIIDEKSLVQALKQNWISGAILDVFESEPLSPTSEIWDMPQVTISPHYSGIGNQKEVKLFLKRRKRKFWKIYFLGHYIVYFFCSVGEA